MIRPALLQSGDTIALVSPAKSIEATHIDFARDFFEQKGLKVITGEHAYGVHTYFSGTEAERMSDFQQVIDNPEIKAIICTRGGYGCIRIVEQLQWANLLRHPKWIVGFSDITVLHQKALSLGVESIHATMPLNYRENSVEALESLWASLSKGSVYHEWKPNAANKTGEATGKLVGGNLSILYSLLATPLCPDFENNILFIEDVDEQFYHLDRMLQTFKLAGILDQISGLVVGGMSDMKDTAAPTNWTVEELILTHFQYRKIPIAFDAPIGHIDDNRAVICGAETRLEVTTDNVKYFLACFGLLFLLNSCVDIFDEIIVNSNGSGTYKYSVNLSASKVKINSILALDSIDGQKVPSLDEIKNKIAFYKDKLDQKEGISNVTVDANYDDFIFKFSCDFTSVAALQNAVRDIVKEESRDKNNPLYNESWLSWDGKQLVRSIHAFQQPLNRVKAEDQEELKKGKYITVSRFDKPVAKCDNATAQISPTKTAVMVKASTFAVAQNPTLLKNTVTLENP